MSVRTDSCPLWADSSALLPQSIQKARHLPPGSLTRSSGAHLDFIHKQRLLSNIIERESKKDLLLSVYPVTNILIRRVTGSGTSKVVSGFHSLPAQPSSR